MTNIEFNYDNEADILEIFIGEPKESYFDEIDNDLFEGHDRGTGEITGFKIFNLTKRKDNWQNRIKISLPVNLKIDEIN